MSHSRNNNIIESDDSDLDPTGYQLETVIAPEPEPIKIPEKSKSVGFNTLTYTLYGNTPQKLVGADPARLRMLINVSTNNDVLIGDASTVSGLNGFNMTNHNSGGAIEINSNEEIWVVYVDSTKTNSLTLWAWIERSVSQ
jgi:hypothetical protein